MKKTDKPSNAIFYGNYKDVIYNASAQQVKELMTAFCQYAFDDITPEVSPDIALVWGVIKGNIDDDYRQYIARCEKNRDNANKRYGKELTYQIDGYEYTLIYLPKNKGNVISESKFMHLFEEIEDTSIRHFYIDKMVELANEDFWGKPYNEYEDIIWGEITKG